ncbi:MAG: UDP-N-acetylmuramoyl-tripeptide--D-alanyl-D-alanine ligase, partial [Pseudonocardia sp.]|nr:UDP-N-acetylmuramoyl-tripeptide--D-alanyl-D-alanine ligase [Pseudonocardia sp.]
HGPSGPRSGHGPSGPRSGRRRTWAVLGRIGELGAGSDAAHARVAQDARTHGVDELVAVAAPEYGTSFDGGRLRHTADVDEALALLRAELRSGDVVLVKASRAAGLERLAGALIDTPPSEGAR